MTNQHELADFARELSYGDLPDAVVEKAKELALHTWGVQLAASTLPWSRSAFRYVQSQGGSPQSTVVNYGTRTSVTNATFVNSTFGHGFEMDDNFGKAAIKGACVVVPPALAVGESSYSSGKDLITAIVAGFEVMLRVAITVRDARRRAGHHGTGNCGAFGAAVSTGKILGFDRTTMAQAIGGASFNSSGLSEAPEAGRGNIKRSFAGMASSAGVRAALLAGEGLTAPDTAVDGVRGFCRAFGGEEADLSHLTSGLGDTWELLDIHYKIYAQDGHIQPMTDAIANIRKRHDFDVEEIDEVRVGTNRQAHDFHVGVIHQPTDITSAQYSAAFSVALFLAKGGAGFQEYSEATLRDPRILSLSERVKLEIDDEVQADWARRNPRAAKVSIRLRSGQVFHEHVEDLRVLTSDEVDEKFCRLASVVLPDAQMHDLLRSSRELDNVTDVARIARLLVSPARVC